MSTLRVATDREHVATRCGHARDVHGVAGLEDRHDFLGIAIDDRNLAGVTQRNREEIFDIAVVLRLGRTIFRRTTRTFHARLHFRHAEFRRRGRFLLQEARHDVDLFRRHFARRTPVGHAGRRTVGDQRLQVVRALFSRDVRRQRFTCRTLAEYAVAACAAFKIQLRSGGEFSLTQDGTAGSHDLAGVFSGDGGWRALVLQLTFGCARVTRTGGTVSLRQVLLALPPLPRR